MAVAAYPEIVKLQPSTVTRRALRGAAGRALRGVAGRARGGLIQVLAGPDPAPARRWGSPRHRRAACAALGTATLALCVISLASIRSRPGTAGLLLAGQLLLAVAVVAPLLLAVRHPLLGWRIGWLALLLAPLLPGRWWGGWPWGLAQVLVLLVLFGAAGIRYGRPALWCMWTLSLIPWWFWLARDLPDLNGPLSATVIFAAGTIALDSTSSRWLTQRALAAQTERTELERARRAVLDERARIAREMHDVVAHHMSLIAVRAETAPYRLSGLTEPVRAEFGALSDVAREALADMRRLLGVLRQDAGEDQSAERAPQPRLVDLPALVEAARRAGVPVELAAPAALDQVPAGVALCAYRIVQESLSNASRHAPGAAVTVSVDRDAGAVLLRVANGPGGPGGPGGSLAERGTGHGLAGMRERVALLGGSLAVGPAPDGGFVVSATLPLGDAA